MYHGPQASSSRNTHTAECAEEQSMVGLFMKSRSSQTFGRQSEQKRVRMWPGLKQEAPFGRAGAKVCRNAGENTHSAKSRTPAHSQEPEKRTETLHREHVTDKIEGKKRKTHVVTCEMRNSSGCERECLGHSALGQYAPVVQTRSRRNAIPQAVRRHAAQVRFDMTACIPNNMLY